MSSDSPAVVKDAKKPDPLTLIVIGLLVIFAIGVAVLSGVDSAHSDRPEFHVVGTLEPDGKPHYIPGATPVPRPGTIVGAPPHSDEQSSP